jgi:uroporphyrinogen-III synthase
VSAALQQAVAAPFDLAILQTGVGVRALLALADENGLREELLRRLDQAVVVARGPKPLAALLSNGVRVDRRTPDPHTTAQVIALLEDDLASKRVLVLQFGVVNDALLEVLRERGAEIVSLSPYAWDLPVDTAPVRAFLDALSGGRVDITTVTSASQVDNLFRIAEQAGISDEHLAEWLRQRTLVAAIGPVSARALEDHGVSIGLMPATPKMVPLVRALCERVEADEAARTGPR